MSALTTVEEKKGQFAATGLEFPKMPPLDPQRTSEVVVRLNAFTSASLCIRQDEDGQALEIGGQRWEWEAFRKLVQDFVKGADPVAGERDPRAAVVALLSSAELNRDGHFDFPGSEKFLTPQFFMSGPVVGQTMEHASGDSQPVELKATTRGFGGALNEGMYATPSHFRSVAVVAVLLTKVDRDNHPVAELIRDIKRFKRTGSLEPIAGELN